MTGLFDRDALNRQCLCAFPRAVDGRVSPNRPTVALYPFAYLTG
jgi:hypothetical protein